MTRWAAALGLAVLASACKQKPVTRDECDLLLARYAEMQARVDDPKANGVTLERARGQARALAAHDRSFAACTTEVSRESMDCALAAHDPDQIERCLIPMP